MKRDIIFLLFVCSVFSLIGCNRELDDDPEHEVSINFTVGSLLKATATPAEDLVNKIVLYGVDGQTMIEKYTITQLNTTQKISKKVKSFYAIANPTSTMENLTTVAELTNLTFDFTAATPPASPFLMSGTGTISGTSVSINLVRMVARIEITCTDSKFTNASITVSNTPRYGYVFPRTPLAVPNSCTRATNSYTNVVFPVSIYVAENTGATLTSIKVDGQYNGAAISPSYTFNFSNNIVRNTNYPAAISFNVLP